MLQQIDKDEGQRQVPGQLMLNRSHVKIQVIRISPQITPPTTS